jgi:hypothetical protein
MRGASNTFVPSMNTPSQHVYIGARRHATKRSAAAPHIAGYVAGTMTGDDFVHFKDTRLLRWRRAGLSTAGNWRVRPAGLHRGPLAGR